MHEPVPGDQVLHFIMRVLSAMPDAKAHTFNEPVTRFVGNNGRDDDTHPDLRRYPEALVWNATHRRIGPRQRFVALGTGYGRTDDGVMDIAANEWFGAGGESAAVRSMVFNGLSRPRLSLIANRKGHLRANCHADDYGLGRAISGMEVCLADSFYAYPLELGGVLAAMLLRDLTDPAPF